MQNPILVSSIFRYFGVAGFLTVMILEPVCDGVVSCFGIVFLLIFRRLNGYFMVIVLCVVCDGNIHPDGDHCAAVNHVF